VPLQELIKQIYLLPPSKHGDLRFGELLGNNNIRFFSYGRYALSEGLRIAGITSGDRVLIPEFICRDLLSAVNSIGAKVDYYPVNRTLQLSVNPDTMPAAKAVLAVNYFGFPQDLRPFHDYCKKTGAVLIEDNAHGLFSKDESGRFLGTRGDIGIFSLRKTLPIPDGAVLVLNNSGRGYKLSPQIEFSSNAEPLSFRVKHLLRRLVPFIGIWHLQFATSLTRYLRKIKTGHEILLSSHDAEIALPGVANPCKNLPSYLLSIDIDEEIERRRKLYVHVDILLRGLDCEPVFKGLPENVVPYGYPFYISADRITNIKKTLKKCGLECFRWPELPDVISASAPEHYKTIWFVSFLW